MASPLALAFDILARDKASQPLKNVGDQAEKTGGKLSGLGTVAKGVGTAFAGIAAGGVVAFGAALTSGIKDAVSFQTLALKTEAVLKSTGNAAGTSVEGIQKLAGSLESLSGVDEELIINSQNVLATFTKIKNQGDDKIFDQATKSALNMSVALGQDLQGATTLVGKALNDPIKGLTALSKAGVGFTEQQKDQIKWMVASGDTLSAQKIILGELETQFGGTAEAAGKGLAGDLARLQDAFADAFRELGTAILPTLTKFAQLLAGKLPGAIAFLQGGVGKIVTSVRAFWLAIKYGDVTSDGFVGFMETIGDIIHRRVLPVLGTVRTGIEAFWLAVKYGDVTSDGFVGFMETIGDLIHRRVIPALKSFAGFVTGDVVPGLVSLGQWVIEHRPVLIGLAVAVGVGLTSAFLSWAAAAGAAAVATVAATLPVLAIGAAIAGLTAGLIYAYQEWGFFRSTVDIVARFLTGTVWPAIQAGARWLRDDLVPAVQSVIEWFGNLIDKADEVGTRIASVVESIVGFFTALPGRLSSAAGDVWGFLRDSFISVINFIIEAWNGLDFKLPSFEGLSVGGQTIIPGWEGSTLGMPDISPISTSTTSAYGGYQPVRNPDTMGGGTTYNVSIVAPAGTVRNERDLVRELKSGQYLAG